MPHVDIELEDNKQFISNIPHNLCPQNVCIHFIHDFELGLGKYTVFLLMEIFLLQTLSIGNNVLISQHLNWHITCNSIKCEISLAV